jgi:hypothetical protein
LGEVAARVVLGRDADIVRNEKARKSGLNAEVINNAASIPNALQLVL